MYEYKCKIIKVIDGDTADVDIDLGFGVWMKKQRVRFYGVDTPESMNMMASLLNQQSTKNLLKLIMRFVILDSLKMTSQKSIYKIENFLNNG